MKKVAEFFRNIFKKEAYFAKSEEQRMSEKKQWAIAFGLSLLVYQGYAVGADLGDGMCKVVDIFTGKVIIAITTVAFVASGLGVLFGGELNDFMKGVVKTIFIFSGILFGGQMLNLVASAMGKNITGCGA